MSEFETKITINEFDKLCEQIANKNKEKEAAAEVLKNINKEINALEFRGAAFLRELGREEYHSPFGLFLKGMEEKVNMPKGEDKEVFFNYLRAQGVFDHYATVQSQSLNAYYRAEKKAAIERGEDPMTFSLPGLPPPTITEFLDFKPAKEKKS